MYSDEDGNDLELLNALGQPWPAWCGPDDPGLDLWLIAVLALGRLCYGNSDIFSMIILASAIYFRKVVEISAFNVLPSWIFKA